MPVRIGSEDQRVRESVIQPAIQLASDLNLDTARWSAGETLSGGDSFWSFIPVYFSHGNRFHSPSQSEFCLPS
ncbi:hypothetical protein NITHO_3070015 [Nitrolancea hollandica Lb]|uniref:Uncharacterized protein n=1 Tax=Nitrolancea hollandica Lb TaxID=1129897 RepID=I4EHC7_9BACT|nr:hypothetical protein NITHO_3070015 [Nitrolancea hollandica Lb]